MIDQAPTPPEEPPLWQFVGLCLLAGAVVLGMLWLGLWWQGGG